MRYSLISAAALAFVSTAFAQTNGFDVLTSPTNLETVAAGTTLDIVWTPTEGYNNDTVTITLLQGGPAQNQLQIGPVVKANISSYIGTYSWFIPNTTAAFPLYGFKLTLDAEESIFQYSFPFHISGLASASSSSVTGSASTTTVAVSSNPSYTASATITTTASQFSNSTITTSSSAVPATTGKSSATPSTSTLVVSKTTTGSSAGSATSTSTPSPSASSNAAMSNVVSGGMAMIGGLALALAM